MKKIYVITGIVVVILVLIMVVLNRMGADKKKTDLFTEVLKGDFEIVVSTSGELLSKNSIEILGPEMAPGKDMRSMDIKIQDLVPEGTMVDSGDYVAQLDKTNFNNTLKDLLETLQTSKKELETKMLDTALSLTGIRDEIKNQLFNVQGDSITLRNSKFEAPTTIRQAEINYDQSKRTLGQRIRRYDLSVAQNIYQINNIRKKIADNELSIKNYQDVLSKFTITAPAKGMVIYKKDPRGGKRKTGSSINPFDRAVATLPDFSSMLSRIYISEIDISKIKMGQNVNISVDALPNKSFSGKITSIANIGEKLPNTDSKVFEVIIELNENEPILRPAMTTSNKVIINTFKNIVYLPAECVYTEEDSIPFVYAKNGVKHIVMLGESNEKNIIVEKGIDAGSKVYISEPENHDKFKVVGKELIPEIRTRIRAKRAENERYVKISDPNKKDSTISSVPSSVITK
jgi:HlyD family secretion protein